MLPYEVEPKPGRQVTMTRFYTLYEQDWRMLEIEWEGGGAGFPKESQSPPVGDHQAEATANPETSLHPTWPV